MMLMKPTEIEALRETYNKVIDELIEENAQLEAKSRDWELKCYRLKNEVTKLSRSTRDRKLQIVRMRTEFAKAIEALKKKSEGKDDFINKLTKGAEAIAKLVHPFYGPCGAMRPDGGCSMCHQILEYKEPATYSPGGDPKLITRTIVHTRVANPEELADPSCEDCGGKGEILQHQSSGIPGMIGTRTYMSTCECVRKKALSEFFADNKTPPTGQ